jgi:DcaP outer membrane protein
MNKQVLSFVAVTLLASILMPAKAQAQNDSSGPSAEELKQQLSNLQLQMQKVQSRLDQLESAQSSSTSQTQAPPASQTGTTQAGQPALQGPTSPQVGEETATYNTFSEDSLAAARYNNVPLDPKYDGFFRLPGTQTILKIGGYFKTDFIRDLKPAGNSDAFVPASIPIPQISTANNTSVSVRPTRLTLDFRIPSTRIGEVRFYVEGDLFGTNATTPRVRHAYAQASNFLIGQTFSNFMDPDGFPDTLDFQGPNGMVNLRNPQLRYGFALGNSTTLYFSAEKPSSDIIFTTPTFSAQPNTPRVDGTVRLRKEFQGGHFQVSGLFRDISAFAVAGGISRTDQVFGWGVNVSTGFKTFGKDNVVFAVAGGHGISRYIQDTSGLGIDAELAAAGTYLKATPAIGIEAAYQHYWRKTLRSSAVYSYAAVNDTINAPGDTYNHGEYTAANLIWNPWGSSLNMGAEFLYGWQVQQDGLKGNAPRIQFSAKYSFVKVGADKK